jgi:hypothetical protein
VDLHDGLIGLEDLAPASEAGHIVQKPQGSQIIINNSTHLAMVLRGRQLENSGEEVMHILMVIIITTRLELLLVVMTIMMRFMTGFNSDIVR